jgi:hypothetical protein
VRVPNLSIIMRDDWIEISCCHVLTGRAYEFKFYADGAVTRKECSPGIVWPTPRPEEPISVYEALAWIADVSADNVNELGGFS